MSDLTDQIRHDVAVLDLVREHLAGRHEEPHGDCLACERDRYKQHSITLNTIGWKIAEALGQVPEGADRIEGNSIDQARELCDAWERERMRNDMMAMQRGAVLEAVHRMQLGQWTKQDIAARVDEIFRAGMAAEIKAGYDEQLAKVSGERDDALQAVQDLTGAGPGLKQQWAALYADGSWTSGQDLTRTEAEEIIADTCHDPPPTLVYRLVGDWQTDQDLTEQEQAQIAAFGAGLRAGITEEADRG